MTGLIAVIIHGAGLLELGRLGGWRERATGQSRVSPVSMEGINGALLPGGSMAFLITLMTRFLPARHHKG